MCLFNGPLGFVTVVPLILSESGAIVLFMARALWLGPAMEETFDAVLFQQGMTQLVSQGREVQGEGSSKRLGKALSRPLNRFTKEGLVRYILSLPLNAIPIVGTIFFLFYNGKKSGPSQHERYFQLKKMSAEQKAQFVESRRGSYTAFGMASMVLNMVPGVSVLLAFATTVGAALWACDIEKKSGAPVDTSVSNDASHELTETGKKME
ncbi:hypothetical protein FRC03_003732 [Tulasnella sp. 419]|nr:hypothetical protein FRC03_003732 [Tulasnella sp. 419]